MLSLYTATQGERLTLTSPSCDPRVNDLLRISNLSIPVLRSGRSMTHQSVYMLATDRTTVGVSTYRSNVTDVVQEIRG